MKFSSLPGCPSVAPPSITCFLWNLCAIFLAEEGPLPRTNGNWSSWAPPPLGTKAVSARWLTGRGLNGGAISSRSKRSQSIQRKKP